MILRKEKQPIITEFKSQQQVEDKKHQWINKVWKFLEERDKIEKKLFEKKKLDPLKHEQIMS